MPKSDLQYRTVQYVHLIPHLDVNLAAILTTQITISQFFLALHQFFNVFKPGVLTVFCELSLTVKRHPDQEPIYFFSYWSQDLFKTLGVLFNVQSPIVQIDFTVEHQPFQSAVYCPRHTRQHVGTFAVVLDSPVLIGNPLRHTLPELVAHPDKLVYDSRPLRGVDRHKLVEQFFIHPFKVLRLQRCTFL